MIAISLSVRGWRLSKHLDVTVARKTITIIQILKIALQICATKKARLLDVVFALLFLLSHTFLRSEKWQSASKDHIELLKLELTRMTGFLISLIKSHHSEGAIPRFAVMIRGP
jgi:hypothetical protein